MYIRDICIYLCSQNAHHQLIRCRCVCVTYLRGYVHVRVCRRAFAHVYATSVYMSDICVSTAYTLQHTTTHCNTLCG